MKKRLFPLILAMFLLSLQFAVAANFSKEKAVLWVDKEMNPLGGTQETSLSFLALESNNIDTSERLQTFLQAHPDNCFPRDNCNIKDTAFGLIALQNLNEPTDNAISWLGSKERVAKTQGDWLIQIISTGEGVCLISHADEPSFYVTVNSSLNQLKFNDELLEWLNVKDDLKINIENATEQFEVDCSDVSGSTIISLLRRTRSGLGEEYRIVQQESTSIADLKLKDVCYGESSCNEEDTFFASWALFQAKEQVSAIQYLKDNAVTNLDYAILYDIIQDERYSDTLLENQNELGNWDNDVFTASVVLYALRDKTDNKILKGLTWLKSKQRADGSLGSLLETSSSVYFAFSSSYLPSSTGGGSGAYCGDGIVQKELGEECDNDADTIAEGALNDCFEACSTSCQCIKPECKFDEDCIPPNLCDLKISTASHLRH